MSQTDNADTTAQTTTDDSGVDAATLDAIEQALRDEARGRENAVTSGELSDRFMPDDGEANPATREAVKILMRERDLPVVGGSTGYYIPDSQEPIDDAIESLEGRIQGIRERQRLLAENWAGWGRSPADDAAAILTAEQREAIENDPVLTVDDVLEHREGSDE